MATASASTTVPTLRETPDELSQMITDALRESQVWLIAQKEAFQAAMNGAPLAASLDILVRTAIKQSGGTARCAFYIADVNGAELQHVTGMHEAYARCVEGFKIGPESLACGLAVHTGRALTTPDVREEPRWKPWLWLAEVGGFRACWSFPIETSAGRIVGTFAMYFDEPRQPSASDLELAAVVTHTAAIIISRHQEAQERARAENVLRASEEQFRAFVDATSDVVYRMSPDWSEMRYLDGKEFIADQKTPSLTWLDKYIHPDDQAQVTAAIHEAIRARSVFELEHRVLRADGSLGWTFSRAIPILDANGEIVEWFGAAADVTERKRAVEQLKESQETLSKLVERAPFGIYIVDSRFRIALMNTGSQTGTFRNVRPVIGRDFAEAMRILWPEPVAAEIIRVFRHTLLTGEPYRSCDFINPRHDIPGEEAYEWELHRMTLPDGQHGVICYYFDSTKLRHAEQALRQSQQRLSKVEKMAAAGQLAASLAHEINNPLSSVTNALYLLEHSDLNSDDQAMVQTAANELARVTRIVKQSLSYYRAGTVPRELDLGAVAQESLQIFKEKIERAGVQLVKKITPRLQIIGFSDEIRQVIDNLLLNALEATPSGGRLAVSLRRSRNWSTRQLGVRLTIADTGCGIAMEHLAHLFEPFFTTKPEKGTGLGLWVVHGIVAKHEGHIDVRSATKAGRSGTAISILWPFGNQGSRRSTAA